jgi:hypothetical protein
MKTWKLRSTSLSFNTDNNTPNKGVVDGTFSKGQKRGPKDDRGERKDKDGREDKGTGSKAPPNTNSGKDPKDKTFVIDSEVFYVTRVISPKALVVKDSSHKKCYVVKVS